METRRFAVGPNANEGCTMPIGPLELLLVMSFFGVPFLIFMAVVVFLLRRQRMPPDTGAADRQSLKDRNYYNG